MSSTLMERIARRLPPTADEVAALHRLWRETPADLYGVRRRFIEQYREPFGRTMGVETVIRYRPDDLPWPTRDERLQAKWSYRYAAMNGPVGMRPRLGTGLKVVAEPIISVDDKPKVSGLPPSKSYAQIQAERMVPSNGDPTPDQIREACRQIRRERGETVLLEIDLR